MIDTPGAAAPRLPGAGRLLTAQIGYQARLLASGRAVTIGIGLPVILLIASHGNNGRTGAASFAGWAGFGLPLTAWNTYGHSRGVAPAAVVALVFGAFAWAATATAVTAVIPTVEAAAPTFLLIYFPIILASGIFGSISEPHWLATIATYLPAEPLTHAVAAALGPTAGHALLPARDLIVLAAWTVAGLAVAGVTFRWEPHRPSPRTGRRR